MVAAAVVWEAAGAYSSGDETRGGKLGEVAAGKSLELCRTGIGCIAGEPLPSVAAGGSSGDVWSEGTLLL